MKFNIILIVILGIFTAFIIPVNAYALEIDNNWNEKLDTKFLDNAGKKAVQASAESITLEEIATISSTALLSITSWSNNKTNDDITILKINVSEAINFNATANEAIDFWNWTMDDIEQEDNNFDNFNTSWDSAGIRTVSVNATNNSNTSNTIIWVIMVNPPEIISWSNNKTNDNSNSLKINISEPINFNISTDQMITTWNWTMNGLVQANNFDDFSTSWDTNGTKTVSVNATNDNGTTDTITWVITINPLPKIVSQNNTKTNSDTLSLKINVSEPITFNISTDQTMTQWNWYKDGVNQINNFDNFSTFWNTDGTYTVSVNATNENGTTNTITWDITINPLPEIVSWSNNKTNNNISSLKINVSEPINFNVSADQTITIWNWYKDGDDYDNNFDNFSTSWDDSGNKTVSVNATNENGTNNTITWDITINPLPVIVSWSNNITNDTNDMVLILTDETINFNASPNQSITTWNWYIEGIYQNDNNYDNLTTSWPDVGIRTVEVNATNDNGTSNTVNWTVTIKAPTGRPPNKGRDKNETDFDLGDMFGDLFVIVRDDNGVPILNKTTGCIIPINNSDGTNITMDYDIETDSCELPAGAEEWVIEVHFGRLAIARSPEGVIEQSFDEAIRAINSALEIKLEASGRFLLLLPGIEEGDEPYEKAIDSSLENLALYKKLVINGHLEGNLGPDDYIDQGDPVAEPIKRPTLDVDHFLAVLDPGLNLDHLLDQGPGGIENEDFISAASFLAAAADKSGHIDLDLVVNLNTIMGLNADLNGNDTLEYEEYVNFEDMNYDRSALYSKDITVLQPASSAEIKSGYDVDLFWKETSVTIYDEDNIPPANGDIFIRDGENPFVPDSDWIAGFVQAADDSLRVIYFVHTYQIPALR